MYSADHQRFSVAAVIFLRTLMNEIYRGVTVVSKNVYISKLNEIVIGYKKIHNKKLMN